MHFSIVFVKEVLELRKGLDILVALKGRGFKRHSL
jgi:hypothetical protein